MRLRCFVPLLSISLLLFACQTIEPVPLYAPPDDPFSSNFALSAATFSPSGRFAAVANSKSIWIFDTASMEERVHLSRQERFGTNNTLIFLDENRIASTAKLFSPVTRSFSAAVKVWDLNNPYPIPLIIELQELDRYAISLGHSRATGALAVGGHNGAVVLLEPNGSTNFSKKSLPGLNGPVLGLAFSHDGSLLAAGGVHPTVPIWSLRSLVEVGSLPTENNVHDLDLVTGKQALLVTSTDLGIWSFHDNDDLESIKNPSLAGDYIVLGTLTATYVVLATVTAALGGHPPLPPWPESDPSEPDYGFCRRQADISPRGEYIVDVHSGKLKEKIRILSLSENKVVKKLNPRGGKTCGVAFSPDGSKLLVANNRVARLYDIDTWNFRDFVLD